MRFWFTPSAAVPLREQIVQQVRLGILGGELRPGERLPSTRQLARRFGMHFNTVSAAFQQLAEEGWLEARHGSGMFVRVHALHSTGAGARPGSNPDAERDTVDLDTTGLDALCLRLIAHARSTNLTLSQLVRRLEVSWQRTEQPARMVLVEPDPALARIVQHEIATATGTHLPLLRMRPADFATRLTRALDGATAVVLPSKSAAAHAAMGDSSSVVTLAIQPVAGTLADRLPSGRDHLVAITSHWAPFRQLAHGMLISAGFHEDSLLLRDAGQDGWREGLLATSAVLCDSLTATELPAGVNAICFRLLSDAALALFC